MAESQAQIHKMQARLEQRSRMFVARMRKTRLAHAFETLVDRIACLKGHRFCCTRLLQRLKNMKLAQAFEMMVKKVEEARNRKQKVIVVLTRWRNSILVFVWDCWQEKLAARVRHKELEYVIAVQRERDEVAVQRDEATRRVSELSQQLYTADELVRNVAKVSQEDCDKDHGNEDTKFAIQALEQECMRVHERLEQHSKIVITRLIVKSMQHCSMYRPMLTGMTSWKLVQNDKFSACLRIRSVCRQNCRPQETAPSVNASASSVKSSNLKENHQFLATHVLTFYCSA
jgi:hypothetical protein